MENTYKADLTKATKEKTYYSLAMFPYPSGAGLHVGHGTNFTANDVVARFKRMQWYTVINPIGWDSFGLPTENYAMKLGRSASEVTAENIANYKKQCELMDWSYDWDREVATSSPEYYKWTQWIFQQLFKAWLVYKKDAFVNRCPTDQTVLANDQVVDGCCERCGTEIIQKKHPQRFIKITDYAERLIDDLDLVDRPEETKTQQKYWIGKSEGAEIDFAVDTGATIKKHYVVLHGYEGNVDANWLPRLAKNLQQAGHTVDLVELPNSAAPIVADQVQYVLDTCTFDENTIVIWHSLWCTVALKALERISTTIEKCILVAWFLTWEVMQEPSDPDYAEEKKFFDHVNATFDRQYDLVAAKQHCKNFVVLHDKNDYAVQLSRAQDLAQKLDTTPVVFEATETHACGKEEPVILEYALGKSEKITVFTTRPDTLFGVTALVLAPENASIDAYIPAEYKQALTDYRLATSKKTNIERQADAETKSGVFSGVYAIHPLTQEKVPVRFADYVLPDYATGAVMFVPAHDERDWAFAQKHGLEVKQVIAKQYIWQWDSAAREWVETLYRKTIDAIIENKNWEILVIKEDNPTKIHFVWWGIEEWENEIEALHKEIIEETWYTEFDVIWPVNNSYINSLWYRYTKQKNQNTTWRFFHVILKSEHQIPSEIEEWKHSIMWLSKDKVIELINREHHKYAHTLFLENWKVMTEWWTLINSAQFDWLDNQEAKKAITQYLADKSLGKSKTTYKLRDWSVSRQRYWGSPIPVYYTFDNNEQVPYFRYTDAVRWVKEWFVTKPRETVQAIIKDVNTNKYLMLERKIDGMRSFVWGWVEEGESLEQAILKEISEEAWFDKIVSIKIHGKEVHREFYHALKWYNQYTTTQCFVVEVDTKDQKEISADEKEKHEPVWMTAEEILAQRENIDADNIYSFELYLWHNIDAPAYTPRYNAYNPHPNKDKRIPHLIPEEQLPVVLPLDLGDYKPAGKSPLADHPTFPYYHAPDGKVYLRECDTLDTFMCSSFYYLRFIDPTNTKELISKEFADKALPVDFYIGGKEHTYGHLLYSRFIHKFLFDQGVVPSAEPFQKLFHQGMILGPDGRKMSKRRGNVITPADLVAKYGEQMGADVLRTYTMFMWPLEVEKAWNDNAVDGVKRFLDRVARVMDFVGKWEASNPSDDKNSMTYQTTIQLHKTIKWVTEDIEKLKFNTAISKLMVFVNHIYDVKQITKGHFATFLQLLAPFATKLSQNLWAELGQKDSIHKSIWPIYDESYLAEDNMQLPVQINGKMRGTLDIKKWLTQDEVFILVQNDEKLAVHLGDIAANPPKKVIFVQDKIMNIIL